MYIIIILLFIISIIIFWKHIIRIIEHKIVFKPNKNIINIDEIEKFKQIDTAEFYIPTKDDNVLYGYIAANKSNNKTCILYLHGENDNIYNKEDMVVSLLPYGNVIMVNYRGYGKSTGIPTEKNINKDLLEVWKYITEKLEIKPKNIFIYGESIGCYFGTKLCTKLFKNKMKLPKLLILQSPYYNKNYISKLLFKSFNIDKYLEIISNFLPVSLIYNIEDEMNNINKINNKIKLFKTDNIKEFHKYLFKLVND